MVNKKIDRRMFKRNPEELQEYLMFQRRGTEFMPRKGKGSFRRKPKHFHYNIDQGDREYE